MIESDKHNAQAPLADEYGNVHHLADELARGGQGVVFRTRDADLAIKQPLAASGQPDKSANLRERFRHIRLLPMPPRVPVSLPLAILRDEPGYVMRLLSEMKPFSAFDLGGRTKKEMKQQTEALPPWLARVQHQEMALRLRHYTGTGSTRRRLLALSKCAAILARLHAAGLVYGDMSTNNAFIGEEASGSVWLIDADNMRFESQNGATVFTPGYGAPEIVRGTDSARPRTDCWAFAVMAFKILALSHPFIGKKVLQADGDEGGWDAEPLEDGAPADLDEQAYAGYLPFIDDEDDDANRGIDGLPRTWVATAGLRRLFQETFNAGRRHPHRRPAMAFWAVELARALDCSLECPQCTMSYFADDHTACPYCAAPRPAFIRATTRRWEILMPAGAAESALPHRLFQPFSFEHNDDAHCHAFADFAARTVSPVRGTQPFPDNLTFEFVGAEE
jgi:hypothetical protein